MLAMLEPASVICVLISCSSVDKTLPPFANKKSGVVIKIKDKIFLIFFIFFLLN